MQINKIRIKNINSLRGTWEIDFTKEPFTSSSLFAITGPTGSGKSTILDAITLALFNRIPRVNSPISKAILSRGGFLLTRNEKECFVELEYSCAAGNFCSKWSTRITRNKTQDDYDMELVDLSTGSPLDIKRSDIPAKNESLIGLNHEQFLRAILLAQGAFSAFLDSNANDRAKLLEDISGTGVYRKLGMKAFELYKSKHAEIETKESLLEEINRQLLGEEEVESLRMELKTVDTDLQNKRELQLRLNALVDVKKRLKGFEDELQQVNGQLTMLEKKAELFNSGKKIKLDQHRALTPYEVDIRNYIGFSERSTETEKLISGLHKRINEQKEVRENLLAKIKQFLNQPVDADNVVSELNEYRDKVLRLQNDLQQRIGEVKNQQSSVEQLLKSRMLVDYKWNFSDADLGEKIVQTQKEVEGKIIEGERKGWLPEELDSLIAKGINRQEALLKLQGRINEFINLTKEVKEQEDQLVVLEKELVNETMIQSLESEVGKLQLNLDQLNANLLRMVQESKEGITALRESLKDNEPCPVCGSLDHPYAGHYIDRLDDHRKLIEKANAELKEQKDSFEKMKLSRLRVQTRIGQLSELLQSRKDSLEPLKRIIETLKKEAGIGEVKSVKIIEDKLSDEKDQLNRMQVHQQQYLLKSELINLSDAVSVLHRLKSGESDSLHHLQEVYNGKNINSDCNQFIDSFNKVNQELNSGERELLQRTSEQLKLKEDLDRLQQKLNSALSALGYLEIETAANSLLNPTDLDAISREEANLKHEETALKTRLQQVYKSIETERKNDQGDKSIESCIVELDEIVSLIKEAETLRNDFAGKLSANDERIKSVTRLQDEIGKNIEENRPWKLLNDLIGDRTGNKFNSFAQELTMAKLIKLTNVHLVQFNDRYILSMPSGGDEDLVIIDGYMGAERRSVKTLSGGEKFMVSLSLALSMSEMASQQVKIQSLFIDEGISTLDPETLDQVVSTLEQLQTGTQKTIGIISHVEALKDRIMTQVQLEKSSTGFSTMKIVP